MFIHASEVDDKNEPYKDKIQVKQRTAGSVSARPHVSWHA